MKNSGLGLWTERKPIHMDEVVEVVACRNSQLVKLVHDCACPKLQAQQLVACAALCVGMHEGDDAEAAMREDGRGCRKHFRMS